MTDELPTLKEITDSPRWAELDPEQKRKVMNGWHGEALKQVSELDGFSPDHAARIGQAVQTAYQMSVPFEPVAIRTPSSIGPFTMERATIARSGVDTAMPEPVSTPAGLGPDLEPVGGPTNWKDFLLTSPLQEQGIQVSPETISGHPLLVGIDDLVGKQKADEIRKGIGEGTAEQINGLMNFFTSPAGLATVVAGATIPGAGRLIGAAMTGAVIKEVPDKVSDFLAAKTPTEKWRLGTNIVASLLLAGGIGASVMSRARTMAQPAPQTAQPPPAAQPPTGGLPPPIPQPSAAPPPPPLRPSAGMSQAEFNAFMNRAHAEGNLDAATEAVKMNGGDLLSRWAKRVKGTDGFEFAQSIIRGWGNQQWAEFKAQRATQANEPAATAARVEPTQSMAGQPQAETGEATVGARPGGTEGIAERRGVPQGSGVPAGPGGTEPTTLERLAPQTAAVVRAEQPTPTGVTQSEITKPSQEAPSSPANQVPAAGGTAADVGQVSGGIPAAEPWGQGLRGAGPAGTGEQQAAVAGGTPSADQIQSAVEILRGEAPGPAPPLAEGGAPAVPQPAVEGQAEVEPTYYHGSLNKTLTTLKPTKYGDFGGGVYVGTTETFAKQFETGTAFGELRPEERSKGGKVYEVEVVKKPKNVFSDDANPLTQEEIEWWKQTEDGLESDVTTRSDLFEAKTGRNYSAFEKMDHQFNSKDWDNFLTKFGYDAVRSGDEMMFRDPTAVRIKPTQTPREEATHGQEKVQRREGQVAPTQAGVPSAAPEAPRPAEAAAAGAPTAARDPRTMKAVEINKELDKLSKEGSKITDEFISTGRGEERPSDYRQKTDPLSVRARENADRISQLRVEIEARYGPNAPSRLPIKRGWYGPREKAPPVEAAPPEAAALPVTKKVTGVTEEVTAAQMTPAQRATGAGQKQMAKEAASVATVMMLNKKVREKSPSEAWSDEHIQGATGNQAMLDSIRDDLLPIYNRLYAPKTPEAAAGTQPVEAATPKFAVGDKVYRKAGDVGSVETITRVTTDKRGNHWYQTVTESGKARTTALSERELGLVSEALKPPEAAARTTEAPAGNVAETPEPPEIARLRSRMEETRTELQAARDAQKAGFGDEETGAEIHQLETELGAIRRKITRLGGDPNKFTSRTGPDPESGGVDPVTLQHIAQVVLFALAGATEGETKEERIRNALIGAGLGAFTGWITRRALLRLKRMAAHPQRAFMVPDLIERGLRYQWMERPAELLMKQPGTAPLGTAMRQWRNDIEDFQGKTRGEVEIKLREMSGAEGKQAGQDFENYMAALRPPGAHPTAADITAAQNRAMIVRNGSSAAGKTLIDTVRAAYQFTGDTNQTIGVKVFDPAKTIGPRGGQHGGWRPIGNIGANLDTRIVRPEIQRVMDDPSSNPVLWNQFVAALIANGNITTAAEAEAYVKALSTPQTSNEHFKPMEVARTTQLPHMAYDNSIEANLNFMDRWANRAAQIKNFGQVTHEGTSDLFTKTEQDIVGLGGKEYIRGLQDRIYNVTPNTLAQRNISRLNTIASGTQLTNPRTIGVNLASGAGMTWYTLGFPAARALVDAIVNRKQTDIDARRLGIIRDSVLGAILDRDMDLQRAIDRGISAATDIQMKYSGYNAFENFTRRHGMLGAQLFLDQFLKNAHTDPFGRRTLQMVAFLKRNNYNANELVAENGSGPKTNEFIRDLVRKIQGGYMIDQVPAYSDTWAGKFFLKYMKFGIQWYQNWTRNVIHPLIGDKVTVTSGGTTVTKTVRDFGPFFRWLATGILVGEGIDAFKRYVLGLERFGPSAKEIKVKFENGNVLRGFTMLGQRAMEDMIFSGMLGVLATPIQMLKAYESRVKFRDPLKPPGLAIVQTLIDFLGKFIEQGKTIMAKDVDELAAGMSSTYRDASEAAKHAAGEFGFKWNAARVKVAEDTVKLARRAAMRYANDQGIPLPVDTTAGRSGKTIETPFRDQLENALLLGEEGVAAYLVKQRVMQETTTGDAKKVLASIRQAVTSRQPIKVGTYAGAERRIRFMEWAKQNLDPGDVNRIRALDTTYRDTAEKLGLIVESDEQDDVQLMKKVEYEAKQSTPISSIQAEKWVESQLVPRYKNVRRGMHVRLR